jgi:hypothetical protein
MIYIPSDPFFVKQVHIMSCPFLFCVHHVDFSISFISKRLQCSIEFLFMPSHYIDNSRSSQIHLFRPSTYPGRIIVSSFLNATSLVRDDEVSLIIPNSLNLCQNPSRSIHINPALQVSKSDQQYQDFRGGTQTYQCKRQEESSHQPS